MLVNSRLPLGYGARTGLGLTSRPPKSFSAQEFVLHKKTPAKFVGDIPHVLRSLRKHWLYLLDKGIFSSETEGAAESWLGIGVARRDDIDTFFASTFTDGARIGPDGRYWLVDGGSSGLNGSAKLVGVNLSNDTVDKIYHLDNIIASDSGIDDVRFNAAADVAYLSDTAGALVVLNMTSGTGVRVLVDDPSAVAWFPMMYNGTLVPGYQGADSTLAVGLDQIEVSPDGTWLYYQPCNGGLYKIETSLVDASLTNSTLAATLGDYAIPVALTPSTGGTTIDGDGNIYFSDTNLLAIWKVTPEGRATILVQDDALLWTDLMWVTADKKLWLPASQMRPGADGLMAEGPNNIFTFPIDAGPSLIDHA
ncbi:hypothetical protein D6C95_05993 [Aureobasidium pullulans]|nr:hypothetical protein D6C95_05993 [Aureobasidium pullulans]